MTFLVGQVIVLSDLITVTSTAAPVDDATETFTVYQPDLTTATPAVVHAATGSYTAQFTPSQDGWHEVVGTSVSTGAGKGRLRFYVSPVP